jgi:hypothetical protein
VLGIRMLMRIKAYEACRPWPTLSGAEDEELIELAGIREPEVPAPVPSLEQRFWDRVSPEEK